MKRVQLKQSLKSQNTMISNKKYWHSNVCPVCDCPSVFYGSMCKFCKQRNRRKVEYAIKVGRIIKPIGCENCNFEGQLFAHHPDHWKPLAVVFLCRDCHKQEHRKVYAT